MNHKTFLSCICCISIPLASLSAQSGYQTTEEVLNIPGSSTVTDGHGSAIANVGDINGDGVNDIAVGAASARPTGSINEGEFYVYSGVDGSVLLNVAGVAPDTFLGYQVASAGDYDLDGINDLLVSSVNNIPGHNNEGDGSVSVYSGANGSLIQVYPPVTDISFGSSIANGGDIDGDGRDDHIVGAPEYYSPGPGIVQIYMSNSPTVPITLTGGANGDQFGLSVDSLGDIDADGVPDLIVGAPAYNVRDGQVYVYSGSTQALLYSYTSPAGTGWGSKVRSAGDLNGDGTPDFMFSTYDTIGGLPDVGSVRAYSGATGLLLGVIQGSLNNENLGWGLDGIGDVNGDDVPDILVGSRKSPGGGSVNSGYVSVFSGADFTLIFNVAGDEANLFLGISVTTMGDLNGDGQADFAAGESRAFSGGTSDVHIYQPVVGPGFTLSGTCPGTVTMQAGNISPNQNLAVLTGNPGTFVYTGNPCGGIVVDLSNPNHVATYTSDSNGDLLTVGNMPPALCGKSMQVVDVNTCIKSDVVLIP